MNLLKSPNGAIYAEDYGATLISFNGTPLQRPAKADDWEVVGAVATLYDWQADPGRYGPHFAVGHVTLQTGDSFIVGGSIVYIRAWCTEHDSAFMNAQIFSGRNLARRASEARGGLAW